MPADAAGWDRRWSDQVGKLFERQYSVLPLLEADEQRVAALLGRPADQPLRPEVVAVRALARKLGESEAEGNRIGRWQDWTQLSALAMEARRSARGVPINDPVGDGRVPPKCTLLGSFEQMGPDDLQESRRFWDQAVTSLSVQGVRLRANERLSAPALVKRFSSVTHFSQVLEVERLALRFPDVATVAATTWLRDARIDPDQVARDGQTWNGRWLHWSRSDEERDEAACPPDLFNAIREARRERPVPLYYAILMLDGDRMGAWLGGEAAPLLGDLIAPQALQRVLEAHAGKRPEALDARRPVGPEVHMAISAALGHFAVAKAPAIVTEHAGTLVYSGGDDVLALLPLERLLACAAELEERFRAWDPLSGPSLGRKATLSAGIAILHIRDDLRLGLETARSAERRAKAEGRNRLVVTTLQRAGERGSVMLPWPAIPQVRALTEAFRKANASDRWAYRLRAMLPILSARDLPDEARRAELHRQAKRSESPWEELLPDYIDDAAPLVALYDRFAESMRPFDWPGGKVFSAFVEAAQLAAFMARGRDA